SQDGTSPFFIVLAGIGVCRIDICLIAFQGKSWFGKLFATVVDTTVSFAHHPVFRNQLKIARLAALPYDKGVAAQFFAGLDFTYKGAFFDSPNAGVATPAR